MKTAPHPTFSWKAAVLFALAALGLRLIQPENRPMHTDEAVNARLLGDMLEGQPYRYDPQDKHGPVLSYVSQPLVRLQGGSSFSALEAHQVRLVPALFGAALLLLLPLLRGAFSVLSLTAAAFWLTLAAPLVYYGRYWIHETLFVFFTLLLIASLWRYLQSGRRGWALAAGLAGGLLLATKETVAITGLAGLLAAGGTVFLAGRKAFALPTSWKKDALLAIGCGLGCAALFFSAFGTHPGGLVDAVRGAVRFVARASGEGHEKPWFTYLQWSLAPNLRSLPWSGWTLAVFSVAGAGVLIRQRREQPLGIFLLLFTAAQAAIYSVIPYKTPWLALNVIVPGTLIAGAGFAWVGERFPQRWRSAATLSLLLLVAATLGWETHRLCFRFPADPDNPLAYSPTSPDILNLQAHVEQYARTQPRGLATVVQVVGQDYWPTPWFLRHFSRVGYWSQIPAELTAPIVISSGEATAAVAERLGPGWRTDFFGLRPEVLVVVHTRIFR